MRAGAGYVTACVPASLNLVFEVRLLEVMTVPLPDEDGVIVPAAADRGPRAHGPRAGARARPGPRSRSRHARDSPASSPRAPSVPLLLDADGLNAHAGRLGSLADRAAPTVLTPHAGELGRLLGRRELRDRRRTGSTLRAGGRRHARRRSWCSRATTRSSPHPSGRVAVSRGGAPALATAGHRRRPLRGDRGVPGQGHRSVPRRLRGGIRARRGRPAGGAGDRQRGRDRSRRDRAAAAALPPASG